MWFWSFHNFCLFHENHTIMFYYGNLELYAITNLLLLSLTIAMKFEAFVVLYNISHYCCSCAYNSLNCYSMYQFTIWSILGVVSIMGIKSSGSILLFVVLLWQLCIVVIISLNLIELSVIKSLLHITNCNFPGVLHLPSRMYKLQLINQRNPWNFLSLKVCKSLYDMLWIMATENQCKGI